MLIFVALALAGFIVLAGSFIFGHDTDHDAEPGLDHDSYGDHGDGEGSTVSFFSTKVIATLVMSFGATGAIAKYYNDDFLLSSLIGLGSGVIFSLLMLLMLKMLYKQQASSIVPTEATLGLVGTVVVSMSNGSLGEIGLTVHGGYRNYSVRALHNKSINKGKMVKVVSSTGPELIVEEIK